jgi:hypothetical protein
MTMNDTSMFPGDEPTKPADSPPTTSRLTFDGPKGHLFKALAEARKHYLPLIKDEESDVKLKTGGGYKHQYATLAQVIASLAPGWSAAGISVAQPSDGFTMWTIVSVGESSMTVEFPIPQWEGPQDFGSLLAYFRRYQLKGTFCVNDSDDDDGNLAQGNQATFAKRQPTTSQVKGPSIPKPLADEVVAAAKANDLGRAEFNALVLKQTAKAWADCDESDATKLLKVLKGNDQ